MALQARDSGSFTPTLQVLGIPALDLSAEPRDGDRGMISPYLRRLVRRVYLPDPATRREPYASPLLATDLTGLPPAVVLTAERDILRAEGDAYAHRLRASGVRVVHDVTPGVDHYFLTEDPVRARTTMAMVARRDPRRDASRIHEGLLLRERDLGDRDAQRRLQRGHGLPPARPCGAAGCRRTRPPPAVDASPIRSPARSR